MYLHFSFFTCQVLRFFRNSVQTVGEGERPGKIMERLVGLPLKIKPFRGILPEGKAQGTVSGLWFSAVREGGYGSIGAVIRDLVSAVQLVAFDDAGICGISVMVNSDVVCFIHSRDHAGRSRCPCVRGGHRQKQAQT